MGCDVPDTHNPAFFLVNLIANNRDVAVPHPFLSSLFPAISFRVKPVPIRAVKPTFAFRFFPGIF